MNDYIAKMKTKSLVTFLLVKPFSVDEAIYFKNIYRKDLKEKEKIANYIPYNTIS